MGSLIPHGTPQQPMRMQPSRHRLPNCLHSQHSNPLLARNSFKVNAEPSTNARETYISDRPGVWSSRREALLASAVLLQQLAGHADCRPSQAAQLQQQQGRLVAESVRSCLTLANIQADYDRYAPSYDDLDAGAASEALGFPELRRQLLQQASGDVLEVAVGTGLNLPLYAWPHITTLTGIDLSPGMLGEAAVRVGSIPGTRIAGSDQPATADSSSADSSSADSSSSNEYSSTSRSSAGSSSSAEGSSSSTGAPVRLVQADVCRLPFPDASFDVVLDTFSLCVFTNPGAALAEMARVLRPGGRLLLLEHSRSDNPLLGAYQGATRSLVAPLSKGCDWGQDVPGMLGALPGITISSQQRHLAGTLVSITATKRA